jgi:acetylornithine/succinyldiaminopimelate/putrescine aminotransferase
LQQNVAQIYVKGVYGNTMTSNPRALEVACAVLDRVTPEFRSNVQERGKEFLKKLKDLQKEFPDVITEVAGTGLLFAAHVNPSKWKVVGFGELEETMRQRGIGVIHGGENALRFTPHFHVTSAEIDLVIGVLRAILAGE